MLFYTLKFDGCSPFAKVFNVRIAAITAQAVADEYGASVTVLRGGTFVDSIILPTDKARKAPPTAALENSP